MPFDVGAEDESRPGPLQGQCVHLALEPSLQPHDGAAGLPYLAYMSFTIDCILEFLSVCLKHVSL